jgi:phosphatidylethanolamine/phosphatidyl-N-methylethanolamine N-methyltransferase
VTDPSRHPLSSPPSASVVLDPATTVVRRRYDLLAPIYDALESVVELRAHSWRRDLWARVQGPRVLELGVGTGKNVRFYPDDVEVVGLDISPRMLARAQRRLARRGKVARMIVADAQQLPFPTSHFDTIVATFLFCSVPDPALALSEALRVLAPGGRILLLEHVLSDRWPLSLMMRWLSPLTARIWGARLDRRTGDAVHAAGFVELQETLLSLDIVRRIEARKPS